MKLFVNHLKFKEVSLYLVKIAWRNLRRNKLRSIISIFAIAAVVMIVIFSRGLMIGFNDSLYNFYINNQTGHVRIVNEDYRLRELLLPLDYTVDGINGNGINEFISMLKDIDGVQHVLPRLNFGAVATFDNSMIRMVGVGVNIENEISYGNLTSDITGRFPEKGNEILIGKGLKNKLNADLGSRITMMISDSFRSLQGRTFEVVGIRETGINVIDDYFFYLPIETAQDILYLYDEASELLIYGTHLKYAEHLHSNIHGLLKDENALDKYSVLIWNKADPTIELMSEVTVTMNIVYIFFIALGTIVLVTTMSMIVRERISEIGMMAALGLKKREIMFVFTCEGFLKGFIGSLAGIVGGGLITLYYSIKGIRVQAFVDVVKDMDILIQPVFYTTFSFENLIVSFLLSIFIVTIACIYPARLAAKMNPVDALAK